MFISEYFIVFPEGDVQEISGRLSIGEMVDVNGRPAALPLPTHKMIVFRVARIKTNEYKGSSETLHYLEQRLLRGGWATMIEALNVSKLFGDIKAVDNISAVIQDGSVFGLIGTNGAGKSTFIRMLCGVLKPDRGEILIDGKPVYERTELKKDIFYISDEQHFFENGTPLEMKRFYQTVYPGFDDARYLELMGMFGLDDKRKINTFSKGMKKQLSVILGISSNAKYLLCDETFDGLDPVMRQAVKSLFIQGMEERNLTPVIASHNLRELEDICDHVGLLHRGGILFSKDLEEMKLNIHRMQCVFQEESDAERLKGLLNVVKEEKRGSLYTLTIRGSKEEIEQTIRERMPLFYELLPLSLEEIFISETEVAGYDIKSLIL